MLNEYRTKKNPHTTKKMNEVKKLRKEATQKEDAGEKYINDSSESSDSSDDSDDYEELVIGDNQEVIKDVGAKVSSLIKPSSKKVEPEPTPAKVQSPVAPKQEKKRSKKRIVINKYYLGRDVSGTSTPAAAPPVEAKVEPKRPSYIGLNDNNFSHVTNMRSRLLHF